MPAQEPVSDAGTDDTDTSVTRGRSGLGLALMSRRVCPTRLELEGALANSGWRPGTDRRLIRSPWSTFLVAIGVAVGLMLVLALPAGAAVFTVNDTTDAPNSAPAVCDTGNHSTHSPDCTLRGAVQAADAVGGSSTITVPAGTYALTIKPTGTDDVTSGDLNVTAAITIQGSGASGTIIDGGGSAATTTDRVFNIAGTGALTMSGVTVQHGHPPDTQSGGGIVASGPLSLTDSVVTSNTVTDLTSTAFPDQTFGGGIQQGCIKNDTSCRAKAPISLTRVRLSGNSVVAPAANFDAGGGLMEETGDPVTIVDSVIDGNSAPTGGGIEENAGATFNITGTTLTKNRATGNAQSASGNASLDGHGGAIESTGGGTVNLSADTLQGNSAAGSMGDGFGGGAIEDFGGTTYMITGSTISGNTAGTGGSSIAAAAIAHAAVISGSSIAGGAIASDGGTTFGITNSTLAGNTASGSGQAIGSDGFSSISVSSVTIDGRGGGSGPQLSTTGTGTTPIFLTLKDTIVNGGAGTDCGGPSISSTGHNLLSDGSCKFSSSGDMVSTDPGLNPLADNGGPTQTESLTPTSPAIDHGDTTACPATDQRGVHRPDEAGSACDIGAYESPTPSTAATAPSTGTTPSAGSAPSASAPSAGSSRPPAILVTTSKVIISHRFLVPILPSGQERIRLVCPVNASKGCSGTLQLVSRFGKSKISHYSLAGGQSHVYLVRPSQRLLRYITSHHPKRLAVEVLVTNTGAGAVTTSQRTIHIARSRKR